MGLKIPADMRLAELAEQTCARAVVSIRDLMVMFGATAAQLREADERREILDREPWRRAGIQFVPVGKRVNGMQAGYFLGEIDWTGTRFEGETPKGWPVVKMRE